jgi:pimeloyl-ACP methyl ester carboxylesterase
MLLAYLTVLLMLLLAGLVLLGVTVAVMSRLLLRPPRMTDGKALYILRRLSPGDLGLRYEDMQFLVHDEGSGKPIPLAAWWIPHPNAAGRCAILVHGYADAKVGAIAWAPMFHELGFNILAIDLRAHGHSGGRFSTAGYYERQDLDQVLTQLCRQRPDDTRQLILFGVSLGAAVVAATAVMREDIAAVIMECPYADFPSAARTHGRLMGAPGGAIAGLALRLAQWLSHADFEAVRPVDLIPRLACPLMIIRGCEDFLVDPADAAAIQAAAARRPADVGPTVYWAIEGCGHVLGLEADPDYPKKVGNFLANALNARVFT